MRISDWSSDVCSSDLCRRAGAAPWRGPASAAYAKRDAPESARTRCRCRLGEGTLEYGGRMMACKKLQILVEQASLERFSEIVEDCRRAGMVIERQMRSVGVFSGDRKSTRLNSSH